MTKLIWALIIAAVVFVGYQIYLQWVRVEEEGTTRKEAPVAVTVSGDSLPGMPPWLEPGYRAAKDKSPAALLAWYKANEAQLADPRKAWLELDLCLAIRRDSPAEATEIFARVKERVPPSSPVWPRVKELEKAFQ